MAKPTAAPAGFPKCAKCAYLSSGTAAFCYGCAEITFTVASYPCPVCTREMGQPGHHCQNPLCSNSYRAVARIDSVAVKTGPIDDAIQALKYRNRKGWAPIFGRIILGYLKRNRVLDEFDLIIANPTFPEPNRLRHTEIVIDAAAREDLFGDWPFDAGEPRALVKTAHTPRSAALGYQGKIKAANDLYDVLTVPDPARTDRARVLIYDDICTTGHQLDRVARRLRENGADHVEALVLARAPYRG